MKTTRALLAVATTNAVVLGKPARVRHHVRHNLTMMTEPCLLLEKQVQYLGTPTGPERSVDCQLAEVDSPKGIPEIVSIDGLPPGLEITSGESTLFARGATINANKLILPPGAQISVDKNPNKRQRRLATTTGQKKILAVRIVGADAATTSDMAKISDEIFGAGSDVVNLKSLYEQCSFDKLKIDPYDSVTDGITSTGKTITNGVYQVTISNSVSGVDNSVIRKAAKNAAAAELGSLTSQFDHVMLCLPPGTSGNWIAYAYVNHWLSVYNDNWCNYPSAQMHELGHNLNLAHSGEGSQPYADQSGMMGTSYSQDEGPVMCFNGAKSWQLDWYNDRQSMVDPLSTPSWSGELVGVCDYNQSTLSQNVVVKIEAGSVDYFVSFNRKHSINSGTKEGGDQVLITTQGSGYSASILVAKLSSGGQYIIPDFSGVKDLVVNVASVTLSTSVVSVAYVEIYLEGTTDSPTKGPTTSSPTGRPSKAPTTSSPTGQPSKAPTTSSPTGQPSKAPTTSSPTGQPSKAPTTSSPTGQPSKAPTTSSPTGQPSKVPTTSSPTEGGTTSSPTKGPTTSSPTEAPTTSSPTGWITILNNDFETGWGDFNDGGSDAARRSDGADFVHSGSYALRIRDGTDASAVVETDPLATSNYDKFRVSFWFRPRGVEVNEAFSLQTSSCSETWATVATWTRGSEWSSNSRWYGVGDTTQGADFTAVEFPTMGECTAFRFRCEGNLNNDRVYIDDVLVEAN